MKTLMQMTGQEARDLNYEYLKRLKVYAIEHNEKWLPLVREYQPTVDAWLAADMPLDMEETTD